MPPWEKYQSQDNAGAGPWSKYQPAKDTPPEKESATSDVAKTLASVPERVAAGTVMALPNIVNQAVAGPQELYRGMTGREHDNSPLWEPFYSSEDVLQKLPEAVRPHTPTTPAGQAADVIGNVASQVIGGKSAKNPQIGKNIINTGKNLAKDESSRNLGKAASPEPPSAKTILSGSQATYADAEAKGGVLSPAFTDRFLAEAEKAKPQTMQGKAITGDNPITKLIEKAQAWRGHPMTLQGAQEVDKALTDEISSHFVNGQLNAHGKAIMDFQDKFRDMIDSAPESETTGGKAGFEALKTARAQWAQAARMGDIEKIMTSAQQMDNPATAIKTGFRTLYKNPKRMRGFTTEEKAAIKEAAESGKLTDTLRVFGSRLIPIAHAAGGGGIGGSLAAHAATTGIRSAAEALQAKRADKVMDLIANRKMPTANEAIGAKVDPLNDVQEYYKNNPDFSKRWQQ